MRNRFFITSLSIFFLILSFNLSGATSLTLTDQEYHEFIKNNPDFKKADQMLTAIWKEAKANLSPEDYKAALSKQKVWIRTERDKKAEEYISSMSKADAYAKATMDRVNELAEILDSPYLLREDDEKAQEHAQKEHERIEKPVQAEKIAPVVSNVENNTALAEAKNQTPEQVQNDQGKMQEDVQSKTQEENQVEVTASGQGTTKIEALNAAWTEAVRLGVGMFVSSKTQVIDDALAEEIILHSRGRVHSYKILTEENKNDIWSITINAIIDKDILKEAAKTVQSQEVKVDLSHIASRRASEEAQKKSTEELINFFVPFESPENFFNYSFEVKEFKEFEGSIYALHTLTVDEAKYKEIIVPKYTQFFNEISSEKSEEFFENRVSAYTRQYNKTIREGNRPYKTKIPASGYKIGGLEEARGATNLYFAQKNNGLDIAKNTNQYILYTVPDSVYSLLREKSKFSVQFYVEIKTNNEPLFFSTQNHQYCLFYNPDRRSICPQICQYIYPFFYGRQIFIIQKLDIPEEYLPFIDSMKGVFKVTIEQK